MKERIRISLCFFGIISAVLAVYFTVEIFEKAMVDELGLALKENVHSLEIIYPKLEDVSELKQYASDNLRITLIKKGGHVLFESDTGAHDLENHYTRPEVLDAFNHGVGESYRYSITLGVNVYYYAKKLYDGNVIRIGMKQENLQGLFTQISKYLIFMILGIVIASIIIALLLSRLFVKPIERLSNQLESIDLVEDDTYKEMKPFLQKIQKQRRELELSLENLQKEKSKISKLKDEFIANASHELKTPLTSILGYAEILEEGLAPQEDIKNFAGKIRKEGSRLLNIANDIMQLSQLDDKESKNVSISEVISLKKIIESVLNDLKLNAEKKRISIAFTGEDVEILGNETLIYEMIYNLVDNGIRYNNEGGLLEVTLNGKKLAVRDNGMGIPSEYQNRIFERFFRVDKSRSKETGGTGLGLAIVKNIVELHHAQIAVKSIVGMGTEFEITFI